ncbi:MAG TPA: hypothetical protein DEV93_19945 [Chloroflexi bacterium]|nr:hypothetical protein [Chloroflexota bacterium]
MYGREPSRNVKSPQGFGGRVRGSHRTAPHADIQTVINLDDPAARILRLHRKINNFGTSYMKDALVGRVWNMERLGGADLDHFAVFGDVYDTLDACSTLETMLSRLKRQKLLSEPDWEASRTNLAAIRERIEAPMRQAALQPKGPR